MNHLSLLPLTLLYAIVGVPATQTEPLRIAYELSLDRCREHSCHAETATRSEVQVTLEEEELNFLTNYVPIELHVGSLAYQLRFNLRQVSKTNQIERSLTIGFSGRMGTLTGKQLTWGEKSFSKEKWSAFKMASVSGASYSQKGESVTPTLTVLSVESLPGKACTEDEEKDALDEADRLKDWSDVYRSFKRYEHCDDGAIAEGYSDTVGRLLATDWRHLDLLYRLTATDRSFRRFVLRHIDETIPDDELKTIAANAKLRCPSGKKHFCNVIATKVQHPDSEVK